MSHAAVEREEHNRTRLIRRLVRQVMHHSHKDALIADLQSSRTYTPYSKESKQMIHTMGNVECFWLCEISPKVQCLYCLNCWIEGIVYCTCATCLFPTESTRKLNRERFDALTVLNFLIKKGGSHGARHGDSEAQREYNQGKLSLRKARKNKFDLILQRFQQM